MIIEKIIKMDLENISLSIIWNYINTTQNQNLHKKPNTKNKYMKLL